jgi:putative restriction endonuclease
VPLISQSGIWRPAELEAALTIATTFKANPTDRPYADEAGADGLLRYKWQGFDAQNHWNTGLRRAMQRGVPLIYFVGIAKGMYQAIAPVYVVDEEPELYQFRMALSEEELLVARRTDDVLELRRYADVVRRQRLHQPVFRARVLRAYENRCALCRLGHVGLLDAAHIRGDAERGDPVVPNGIAMCKLHHATFDQHIVGIDPRLTIHVRDDVLHEIDGPTLQHSIKELNGTRIVVPRSRVARPDPSLLEERYEQFRIAG